MEIAQWIVRAVSALRLRCTYGLIHRYSYQFYCDLQYQPGKSSRRYRPLVAVGMAYGLVAQVNPLASSETTVLKTRFGPGDAGCPLNRFIAFDRNQLVEGWPLGNYRSCYLDEMSAFRTSGSHTSRRVVRSSTSVLCF